MLRLIDGYRRFRANSWPDHRRLFEALADQGQAPRALVIACADSRVDPAMIFDAAPGELFVIRNVANLVPPYEPDAEFHGTSAALEFAVRVLQVRDIVVMGHALCGGIRALMQGMPEVEDSQPRGLDFLADWMRIAAPARAAVLACDAVEDQQLACEHEAVKVSLRNLMTFPWVAARMREGSLALHGTHFDIRSGVLTVLRDMDDGFGPA